VCVYAVITCMLLVCWGSDYRIGIECVGRVITCYFVWWGSNYWLGIVCDAKVVTGLVFYVLWQCLHVC